MTYNVSPAVVYVIANTVNSTRYEFAGQNTMQTRGERHACVYQRAGTTAAARPPAAGNPLFGAWILAQPAPKGCYTAFRIGPDKTVGIDYSGEEWSLPVTSYEVRGGTVIANGSAGAVTYTVSGSAMRTGVPSCNYKRG